MTEKLTKLYLDLSMCEVFIIMDGPIILSQVLSDFYVISPVLGAISGMLYLLWFYILLSVFVKRTSDKYRNLQKNKFIYVVIALLVSVGGLIMGVDFFGLTFLAAFFYLVYLITRLYLRFRYKRSTIPLDELILNMFLFGFYVFGIFIIHPRVKKSG